MTYSISKDFEFAAAHHLPQLPEDHQCRRPHGHNYLVRVEVESDFLDRRGFVIDYAELGFVKEYLDGELDHRDLNEVLDFEPTAERLAEHLFNLVFQRLLVDGPQEFALAVGVQETPRSWAWYGE